MAEVTEPRASRQIVEGPFAVGGRSPGYIRPPNAWLRCLGALALVWALSFAVYPLQLTALAAAAWIIVTLLLVPIGTTLTDRIVGLLLLAAAPAVLIAWFTPFVPWLVSAPVLTGLLGSLVALAWGIGWTRKPPTRLADAATIAMGVLTAAFYAIPFATGGTVRAISVLSDWLDASGHYGMWRDVWANHGYLLFNTLPDPTYWGSRTYPQGAHALLADLATVLTGDSQPIADVDQSVALFAILGCLLAGALALVAAWSVDRLSRSRKNMNWRRVAIFQVLAVLLVALGPGSVVSVQSLSFTAGLVVVIPSMALAATAGRSPRLAGLLIGASLIAAAAVYPICALLAVVLWPLYLWTSRGYWLTGNRRRWYGAGWTAGVALLCAPPFLLLVLRNVDHDWETAGYVQVLNPVVYASIAILLTVLIVSAPGRLPKAVQYALWLAAAVSGVLIAEGLLQWFTEGEPSYYTVKTMYLGWMLSVIAVGAGLACVRKRRSVDLPSRVQPAQLSLLRIVGAVAGVVFVVGSLFTGVLLSRLDLNDPTRSWQQSVSKEAWVIVNAPRSDRLSALAVRMSEYGAQHDGVTVVVPCTLGYRTEQGAIRWAMYINGGINETELEAQSAACDPAPQTPLGELPDYLRAHPEVTVNALTTDQGVYEYALSVKTALGISNLEVVPPPSN